MELAMHTAIKKINITCMMKNSLRLLTCNFLNTAYGFMLKPQFRDTNFLTRIQRFEAMRRKNMRTHTRYIIVSL